MQNAVIRIRSLSFIFFLSDYGFAGPPSVGEMAIMRNCAAGPRNKRRKICERISRVATVYDRRSLQMTAVIDRRYSLDTWVDRTNHSQVSRSSSRNCRCKCRRADFLMARRSAATASFSARRCGRVRVSTCLGKCEIFGRRSPTFRSLGFAYGFITKDNTVQYRCWHRHTGTVFGWLGSATQVQRVGGRKDACGYEHLMD